MTGRDKPHIVHVITGLETGGAERMLARIVRRSKAFAHEVVVLAECGRIGEQIRDDGIEVHALGAKSRRNGPSTIARLARHLRQRKPDLVQSWLIHANLAAALATPAETPLVWSVRHTLEGLEEERWSTRVAVHVSALAARRARRIFYNSARAAEQHEAIGYPRSKREVIANGFEVDLAREARARREGTRHELGLRPNERVVGIVARVHPIKNHAAFFNACRARFAEHPHLRLVLAGMGTEPGGALAAEFAESFGDRAIWLGERRDVLDCIAALDILANVSLGEAFSNIIGEGMACGVPCVVTDVGESVQIVGDTGWVCADTSSEAIGLALDEALACPADELAARSRAARRRLLENFSLEAVIGTYEQLYDEVCGTRGPHTPAKDLSGECVV